MSLDNVHTVVTNWRCRLR